jgi:hypothetical protein
MSRLLAPFNLLASLPLASVVDAPVRLVNGISKALPMLEKMTDGVDAMQADVKRMADGVERLEESVVGLREDVQDLGGSIGGIRDATVSLDAKIDEVANSLVAIDALTARLGWIGGRRRRKGAADPDAPEPSEGLGDDSADVAADDEPAGDKPAS